MFQEYNDNSCTLFSSPRPETLYQSRPSEGNAECWPSWTVSLQSYQKAARKEYNLLLMNPRRPEHEIVIRYQTEFFIQDIRDQFKQIKQYLQQQGIIAYSVAEITRDKSKTRPVNRIHYHFLVTSDVPSSLSENLLREVFKEACRYAGLTPDTPDILDRPDAPNRNCIVHYNRIEGKDIRGRQLTPEEAFDQKVRYILKYNSRKKPILFQSGTKINKIASIGRYFINPDGSKASKKVMWKQWCIGKYPETAAEKFLEDIMLHLPKITIRYSGAIRVGDRNYHWGN